MNKLSSRFLAVILSIFMAFCLLPTNMGIVFADEAKVNVSLRMNTTSTSMSLTDDKGEKVDAGEISAYTYNSLWCQERII